MIWQACVKKSRRKRFVSWIRFLNKQFEEIKLSECKWYLETLRMHGFELPTTRFLFCVLKVHLNMTRMTCWFFQLAPGKEVRQTTASWEWNLLYLFSISEILLLHQLKSWNTAATTTVILIKAFFFIHKGSAKSNMQSYQHVWFIWFLCRILFLIQPQRDLCFLLTSKQGSYGC